MENKNKYRCEGDDCEGTAKFECEDCGQKYCQFCADNSDYECDCDMPPRIVPIKDNQ